MENDQFEQYGDASNVRTFKFRSSYGTKISKVFVYGSNEFGEICTQGFGQLLPEITQRSVCARVSAVMRGVRIMKD